MAIFNSYVKLPEGIPYNLLVILSGETIGIPLKFRHTHFENNKLVDDSRPFRKPTW